LFDIESETPWEQRLYWETVQREGRTIHVVGQSYSDTAIVDISSLKDVTQESIDSLRFYNLTLAVDSNYSNPNATVSGTLTVNDYPLITLTNVPRHGVLTGTFYL
jgi:hypothetical protein